MIFTLNQTQRAELARHIYYLSSVARRTPQPCLRHTVSWIKDTYALLNWYESTCLCVCYNLLKAVWIYWVQGLTLSETDMWKRCYSRKVYREKKERRWREIKGLKHFIKLAYWWVTCSMRHRSTLKRLSWRKVMWSELVWSVALIGSGHQIHTLPWNVTHSCCLGRDARHPQLVFDCKVL